jgi:uncharacterized membrane protein (UPF0127 family)
VIGLDRGVSGRLDRLVWLPLGAAGVHVAVASGLRARLLGLAGVAAPPPGLALLLAPCRSVHTCGMRWPLDLVWLGAGGAVVRVDRDVRPWRIRSCRRALAVVEVPAGGASEVVAALHELRH